WSSDVCSSVLAYDLPAQGYLNAMRVAQPAGPRNATRLLGSQSACHLVRLPHPAIASGAKYNSRLPAYLSERGNDTPRHFSTYPLGEITSVLPTPMRTSKA